MMIGGGGGAQRNINVTPLVDVVLVLLIIFMVAAPLVQVGERAQIPPPAPSELRNLPQSPQVVVRLDATGAVFINSEPVAPGVFRRRLREVLASTSAPVVFLAASGELPYDQVVSFFEECRESGVEHPALVLAELAPV